MYQAKQAGKNRCHFFDHDIAESIKKMTWGETGNAQFAKIFTWQFKKMTAIINPFQYGSIASCKKTDSNNKIIFMV
jgi:hypothetical protein